MSILTHARAGIEALRSLFFPPFCVHCGCKTEEELLCAKCADSAVPIRPPFCQVCSRPFFGAIDGVFTCPNCEGQTFHFDCAFAAYRARGVVRSFVHRFKYDRQYFLRHLLARWLIEGIESSRIAEEPFDALVPVPLHPVRQRNREFNQAEVLSLLASKHCGKPTLRCLRRIRNTETQTHFDRKERMENLRNAFDLRKSCVVQGMRLLLIDDVLTTGATLDECSRVLRQAGAITVRAALVARG